jgi:hypothetical protein
VRELLAALPPSLEVERLRASEAFSGDPVTAAEPTTKAELRRNCLRVGFTDGFLILFMMPVGGRL